MAPTTRSTPRSGPTLRSASHKDGGTPTRKLFDAFEAEHKSAKADAKEAKAKAGKVSLGKRVNCHSRRNRRGSVTLRDIKKLQMSTHTLIPKSQFLRLAQKTLMEQSTPDWLMSAKPKGMLQESYEARAIEFSMDVSKCAKHTKRKTVMKRDSELVHNIQKKLTFS